MEFTVEFRDGATKTLDADHVSNPATMGEIVAERRARELVPASMREAADQAETMLEAGEGPGPGTARFLVGYRNRMRALAGEFQSRN